MDEVDSHILKTCRKLDCSFIENADFKVAELTSDECVEIFVRCIWAIYPNSKDDLSSFKLSTNISQRFRTAMLITNWLKKCNISVDFGYHTLLYGNISELRKIFIDVIEKLPKENVLSDEKLDSHQMLLEVASLSVRNRPVWVPEFCRRLRLRHDGRFWCPGDEEPEIFPLCPSRYDFWEAVSNNESRFWIANLIFRDEYTDNSCLNKPSLGAENKLISIPRSKPMLPPKPAFVSMGKLSFGDNVQLDDRRADLIRLLQSIKSKENDIKLEQTLVAKIRTKIHDIENYLKNNEERLVVLLENPETGKRKLLDFIDKSDVRLAKLEMEWNDASKRMEDSLYRVRKEKTGVITNLYSKISYNMNCLESLQQEMESQLALEQKLIADLANLHDNGLNRSGITRRIMEMTSSIRKQHDEIDRVLQDNLVVQRELKWLNQTLDRTFTIIEDQLYKDTENHKGERAYKLFARAHTLCMDAIAAIEKNGNTIRQSEELIDLIELEKQKNMESQLERILKDLHVVEEENKRLTVLSNSLSSI